MVLNPKFEDFIGQGLVSFSYDDGAFDNYELGIPLHEQYNIPASFNIISSVVNGEENNLYASSVHIKHMSDLGYEISSHSHNHQIPDSSGNGGFGVLTREEYNFEFSTSNRMLREWDIPRIEGFVVPGSRWTVLLEEVAKDYYKYIRSMGNGEAINTPLENPYHLYSFPVLSYTGVSEIKMLIDEAIEEKKWLILMLHGLKLNGADGGTYTWETSKLEEVLAYINSKPKEELLAINKQDAVRYLTGLGDYSVSRVSITQRGNKLIANGYDEFDINVPTTRGFNPQWTVVSGEVNIIPNPEGTAIIHGNGIVRMADTNDPTKYEEISVSVDDSRGATLNVLINNTVQRIPLLPPSDVTGNQVKINVEGEIYFLNLTSPTDPQASEIRIFVGNTIKAVRK